MGAESHVRQRIVQVLRPYHAVAIESGSVGLGIPDVNFVFGWIELKVVPRWPRNAATPLRVPHYTEPQRIWNRRRAIMSRYTAGRCQMWVLIRVGADAISDWLLFDGDVAAEHLGHLPREELIKKANAVWYGRLNETELIKCLTP